MIRHTIVTNLKKYPNKLINASRYSTNINIETLEKENAISNVLDEEAADREADLQRKRDKSRLNPHHRNIVNGTKPYDEPMHWSHGTVRYHRTMYGRYGAAGGVNPAYCWPTKAELEDTREYERVKYSLGIKEMIEASRKTRAEKQEAIDRRQREIAEKMTKLDGWMKELQAKIAKKETEARAAKERKDKLIEEVRRHFGYTVDPRDQRFKDMLEKKEKEQKKQMKEARKKLKEAKLVEKLTTGKKQDTTEEVTN